MINFDGLKEEYALSIEDDDKVASIKEKLFRLSEVEQRIILLYIDCESYSEVARQFHCSAPTVKTYILRIKEKIIGKNGKK